MSTSVKEIAGRARAAARVLSRLSNDARNEVLLAVASGLDQAAAEIVAANAADCAEAEKEVAAGRMTAAMLKRLRVSEAGVKEMALRVRDVTRLPDPLGRRLAATELDAGLVLVKESCALGVIGIVFESRPEVISQVASLTLKSSNAVIMKGGSESARTNEVIVGVWRKALAQFPAVPADAVQMIRTREEFAELLTMDQDVDLIVPRGSYDLVHYVMSNSRIPVLGHGEGVCHVYVDRAADIAKALAVAFDSKVQYPAVCNAAETLLIDEAIAASFLPKMLEQLAAAKVEVRVCPKTLAAAKAAGADTAALKPASEQDWRTEYSDLILSVKLMSGLDEAIEHINRYGSKHTDAIVTEDTAAAERFLNEVDSAGVYHNASTRFADGFRYGLGAEIGISNGKVHARGPVGLEGLTTYKWKLRGHGDVVADYASGKKQFTHRTIQ